MAGRWSFGGTSGNAFQAVMIGLEEPEGLALDIFSESLCRAVAGHDWETFGFPFTQVFEPSVLYEIALIQGIDPQALATLDHRPTATTKRLAAVVAAPEGHTTTALVNAASVLTCAGRFARASELVEHAATRSPSGREAFELDWLRFVVSNRTDDGASSPAAFARMQAAVEAGDVPPSRAMDACTQAVVWYVKRREIPAETFRWFARHGAELSAEAGVLTSGGLSAWYRGLAMVPAATGQPGGARRYMEKALEAAELAEQTSPGADARNARKTYLESTIKEHLYVTGDLDAALAAGLALVDLDPVWSLSHGELAEVHERREETELAAERYEEAARLGPPSVGHHLVRAARCRVAQGQVDLALEHHLALLALDPRDPAIRRAALEVADLVDGGTELVAAATAAGPVLAGEQAG